MKAEKDYTRVYTPPKKSSQQFLNRGIGTTAGPSVLIRIHRSQIVNLNYIQEVHKENSDTYLILRNDLSLKVSKG